MSVTQLENGRWVARFPVGGGKYQTKRFDTKREAKAHEAKMVERVRGGSSYDPKKAKETVSSFAWDWHSLQPDTPTYQQNARYTITNHLIPELGSRAIGTITAEDLQRLIKKLSATLEPATVRTVMSTVNMIFRAAHKKKVILADPTIDQKLPKIVKRQLKPLTVEQVHLLAENIYPRYRAVVLFAAASGLRQGEVFAVRIGDINWTRGQGAVTVHDQIQSYVGTPQALTGSTKGRADRTVPLPDDVLELLEKHIAQFPPVNGFVFTNTRGRPLHRRVFDRAFEAARRRAAAAMSERVPEGSEPLRRAAAEESAQQLAQTVFHGLRHFYASLLIFKGLSPRAVATRLGHANASMTLSRYAHLWPDDEGRTRDATEILFAP